jgi:hypothetical protein
VALSALSAYVGDQVRAGNSDAVAQGLIDLQDTADRALISIGGDPGRNFERLIWRTTKERVVEELGRLRVVRPPLR